MSPNYAVPRQTNMRPARAGLRWLGLVALCGLLGVSQAQTRSNRPLDSSAIMPTAVMLGTDPLANARNTSVSMAARPAQAAIQPAAIAPKTQKEYEAQLSAIRQAILEATIDRPTRVLSTAWVDDKGALHESAHFNSEAQVRGVRVMSYVQGDEEPKTQVSAEVLPWGWRAGKEAKAQCSPPPRAWRLPLLLQTRLESGFSGRQLFASQALLNSAQNIWLQQMGDSQRWRTRQKELPPDNAYMRALTGPAEGTSGWAAELTLKPHARAAQSHWVQSLNPLTPDEADWRWTLSLAIGQRHSPTGPLEVQWQAEQVVAVSPEQLGRQPSAWLSQMQNALQNQMQTWVRLMDQQAECEPVQFHVRRNSHDSLQLQAGFESGLRAGDRVLLVNPAHVPSRILEPGVAQHLVLAQVVRVGPERTELQQLAGPALAAQGHWMALPL